MFACQERIILPNSKCTKLYSSLTESVESEDATGSSHMHFWHVFFYTFNVLLYGVDICLLPVFGWALWNWSWDLRSGDLVLFFGFVGCWWWHGMNYLQPLYAMGAFMMQQRKEMPGPVQLSKVSTLIVNVSCINDQKIKVPLQKLFFPSWLM